VDTYSKPALSKEFMQGRREISGLQLPPIEVAAAELTVFRGRRCAELDVAARSLRLDDGATVGFDHLLICTGAEAYVPSAFSGVKGVLPLRTVDDAVAIRRSVAASPKVLILGGGLIGCEIAASMRSMGLDVTIVERLDRLLDRPFGGALSDYFLDLHQRNGVKVLMGSAVAGLIEMNGAVAGAELADGTLVEAGVVLVGAGSRPATQWLERSGIELADGVVCDEFLETSVSGVFAAGDVARWPNPVYGVHMRVEHWTNASAQGRAAARNLIAEADGRPDLAKPFGDAPYFWTDQYGQKIQMAGWHEGYDTLETEFFEGGRGALTKFCIGDRLVAAAAINSPRAVMQCRRQIEERARARRSQLTEMS
jgi:NADPH-dependent 2,4-dienoyl-CoA reductase/sulfur reductase-like enzyme